MSGAVPVDVPGCGCSGNGIRESGSGGRTEYSDTESSLWPVTARISWTGVDVCRGGPGGGIPAKFCKRS